MKKHSPRIVLVTTLVVMFLVGITGFIDNSIALNPAYPYVTFFLLLASPAAVLYLVHSEVK